MKRCILCDRTSKTHKISAEGVCRTCDVSIIYWRKKTSSQIVRRARQLDSFQNRMELLLGNVRRTSKKKRRKAG